MPHFKLNKRIHANPCGILLLVLIMVSGLMSSGCGPPQPEQVTLEFWTISLKPTFTAYVTGLMRAFSARHPGIALEWIDVPINVVSQKLMASMAGGVPPDLVNLNSDYALALAQHHAVINMDAAASPEFKQSFFPGIWQSARYQGGNYAVPWYVSTPVILYNKTIFARAGLNPDRPPRTWAEVEQAARRIKSRTGLYGFMPSVSAKDPVKFLDDLQGMGIPIVSQAKQAVFAVPAAADRLQWYVTLYREDIVPKETVTQGYQGALDRYQSGALGMLIAGPQFILRIAKNAPEVYAQTMVAPYPVTRTGIIPAAVMNWVIPAGSRHKTEALELLAFISNKENQLNFCKQVPLLPSNQEAARDPYFTAHTGENLESRAIAISIEQLPDARSLSLGLPDAPRLYRALKEAIEKAYYGRVTPLQALQAAQEQWNAILEQNSR